MEQDMELKTARGWREDGRWRVREEKSHKNLDYSSYKDFMYQFPAAEDWRATVLQWITGKLYSPSDHTSKRLHLIKAHNLFFLITSPTEITTAHTK